MLQRWWLIARRHLGSNKKKYKDRQIFQHYIVFLSGLLLAVGLWIAMSIPAGWSQGTGLLEIGKPSPITIQAPHSVTFNSDVRLAAERAKAESRPENLVYSTDLTVPIEQRKELDSLLLAITIIRDDPSLNKQQQIVKISALSSGIVPITGTMIQNIVFFDKERWKNIYDRTINTYDQILSEDSYVINKDTLKRIRERKLPYLISRYPYPERDIIFFFVNSFLRVNYTLDEAATQQRKQEARNQVGEQKVTVQAGENIVRAGDFVTSEMIEKARATGAIPVQLDWIAKLGLGLLSMLLSLSFILYMVFLQKYIVQQPRPLLVIIMLLIITGLAAKLLYPLWTDQQFAFPMATTILVLTVVFNTQIALAGAVLLSIVMGMLDSNALSMTVTMFLGSLSAIFAVRGADRPLTFLLAGVGIAIITTISQLAFCLLDIGANCTSNFWSIFAISGINGGLSAILSLGLFNLIGYVAGVVTPIQMMELSHPSQPLLKKMIHEAPGTYYHSVAVANLAEAAANAVGADALLLRVAAYYHDIGKTIRPFFFTDNQTGRENVHNELDPHTSADIIIDHVREGIKMAQAARLPQQIIDFIPTHHGTSIVAHFYQMALRQADSVDIEDFRYPGPKPWTREHAILMLSDSVEATVRSKAQNGKLVAASGNGKSSSDAQTLEDLVNSIIDERVRSGQLDNTPLTLKDLILIRQAFIVSLKSIYHPRVEYARPFVQSSTS